MTAPFGSLRILDEVGGSTLLTITTDPVPAGTSGYELLDSLGLEQVQQRRDAVSSPYIDNERAVSSVEGALRYSATIHCVGATTYSQAKTLKKSLIDLVTAQTFAIGETLQTTLETFDCEPADWTARNVRQWLLNNRIEVQLSIPCRRVGG